MDIRELAEGVQSYVVDCRRVMHRWPETAMEEFRTTDFICGELDKMGISYRRFEPTGCVADIHGARPGRTIALRADIDALKICELADLPFRSEREGYMHSCAHDTHAAMLLGAAKVLNSLRDSFAGTVRLLFQPAEENGTGAKAIIEQGALDGVDAIFGEHVFGGSPLGRISTKAGAVTPYTDTFYIKVHGVSSHGAMPNFGVDATVCAAAMVMNLQSIVSRELPPMSPAVVTVGSLHSGTAYNIVSGEAVMEGTVRIFDSSLHDSVPAAIRRIVESTAAAYRCTAELEYVYGSSALINDAAMVDTARAAAQKVIRREEGSVEWQGMMGGEDFSAYCVKVPGAFVAIGCGGTVSNHNEYFVVDEGCFPLGVALHVQTALDYLAQ